MSEEKPKQVTWWAGEETHCQLELLRVLGPAAGEERRDAATESDLLAAGYVPAAQLAEARAKLEKSAESFQGLLDVLAAADESTRRAERERDEARKALETERAKKGDRCAACGAEWLDDSAIDSLSDLVEGWRKRLTRAQQRIGELTQERGDYRDGASAEAKRCDELLTERNRARNETLAAKERIAELEAELSATDVARNLPPPKGRPIPAVAQREAPKAGPCCSRGKASTHRCDEEMQFVCGYPLCGNCEHYYKPDKSWGHRPNAKPPHTGSPLSSAFTAEEWSEVQQTVFGRRVAAVVAKVARGWLEDYDQDAEGLAEAAEEMARG